MIQLVISVLIKGLKGLQRRNVESLQLLGYLFEDGLFPLEDLVFELQPGCNDLIFLLQVHDLILAHLVLNLSSLVQSVLLLVGLNVGDQSDVLLAELIVLGPLNFVLFVGVFKLLQRHGISQLLEHHLHLTESLSLPSLQIIDSLLQVDVLGSLIQVLVMEVPSEHLFLLLKNGVLLGESE